jgi:hypothetical protein
MMAYNSEAVHELDRREFIEMVRTTSGWTLQWCDGVYYLKVPNVGKFTCKGPAGMTLFPEKNTTKSNLAI